MLSREEVLKIARLARLRLTEEEVSLYQKHLTRVLGYIAELNQVTTPQDANAAFVKHVPVDAVSLRDDEARPFADPSALLKNAPETEEGSFLLPTVVDHA